MKMPIAISKRRSERRSTFGGRSPYLRARLAIGAQLARRPVRERTYFGLHPMQSPGTIRSFCAPRRVSVRRPSGVAAPPPPRLGGMARPSKEVMGTIVP